MLFFFRNSFVLENGLLPKKPFRAENGEGCADSIIRCFGFVINSFLFFAYDPHNIKTTGVSFLFIILIILSVKFSHPLSL